MNSTALPVTTVHLSAADTAKLIRVELKRTFAGVKFSVRVNSYAGGASINVRWTDGPRELSVSAITDRYRGADFDGQTDSMNYLTRSDEAGNRIRYGANFVFTRRQLSEEAYEAAKASLVADPTTGLTVDEMDRLLLLGSFVDAPAIVWAMCQGSGDAPMDRWIRMWAEHLANS